MKSITHAFATGSVLLDLQANDMAEICGEMLDLLVLQGRLSSEVRDRVHARLMAREEETSTAIGTALAVPHAYVEGIAEPIIVFARLNRPIQLGAPDGVLTQFVFLLLGPPGRSGEHLDSLANIARIMSDAEFRYEVGKVQEVEQLDAVVRAFYARVAAREEPMRETVDLELERTGRLGGGVAADIRRRFAHYRSDLVDGLHPKVVGATTFLYFACLAPAVTFGGVMSDQTAGTIGAVEMLVATAFCGIVYALFSGQPLIILGGTGPLLIITAVLFEMCVDQGLPFLAVYGWVGLWSALFLIILALTDASAWMRFFTRFTDEIFAALISIIFIYEALSAILGFFDLSTPGASHDAAFLSLVLALGCFYVAISLFRFRRSRYLLGLVREFLADFGPAIALVVMTGLALSFPEIEVEQLRASDTFGTTSGRTWTVDFFAVSPAVIVLSAIPALLVTILVFLDQQITARVVNSPDHKLVKGSAYHLDLLIVGVLMGFCSAFGLPWLVAATVRSLNHVRALATMEEQVLAGGGVRHRVLHTRETRVTGILIHVLIGLSLLALPLIKMIPMSVLYGLFLYMGVVSIKGNQFFERLMLLPTDPGLYPRTHYIRQVPTKVVHGFTLVQGACLTVLWIVKSSALALLFPVFIAILVPVRQLLGRFMRPEHLEALDSDETPEDEEENVAG